VDGTESWGDGGHSAAENEKPRRMNGSLA